MGIGVSELGLRLAGHHPKIQSEYLLADPGPKVLDKDLILIDPDLLSPDFYSVDDNLPTIVAIGDSFTAGFPVGRERSYPAKLERILSQAGLPVNMINAGVGDSGPDQHFRLLTTHVLPKVRPTVVVWAFFGNDLGDNCIQALFDLKGGELHPLDVTQNFLYKRQQLFLGFPLPASLKRESYMFRLLLKATERLSCSEAPPYGRERHEWGLEKVRLALIEVERLAAKSGFLLYTVLVAPEAEYAPETFAHAAWVKEQTTFLRSLLEDRKGYIHAWFPETDREAIFSNHPGEDPSSGARHFSEHGYQLMATTVADRLIREKARWAAPSSSP